MNIQIILEKIAEEAFGDEMEKTSGYKADFAKGLLRSSAKGAAIGGGALGGLGALSLAASRKKLISSGIDFTKNDKILLVGMPALTGAVSGGVIGAQSFIKKNGKAFKKEFANEEVVKALRAKIKSKIGL